MFSFPFFLFIFLFLFCFIWCCCYVRMNTLANNFPTRPPRNKNTHIHTCTLICILSLSKYCCSCKLKHTRNSLWPTCSLCLNLLVIFLEPNLLLARLPALFAAVGRRVEWASSLISNYPYRPLYNIEYVLFSYTFYMFSI